MPPGLQMSRETEDFRQGNPGLAKTHLVQNGSVCHLWWCGLSTMNNARNLLTRHVALCMQHVWILICGMSGNFQSFCHRHASCPVCFAMPMHALLKIEQNALMIIAWARNVTCKQKNKKRKHHWWVNNISKKRTAQGLKEHINTWSGSFLRKLCCLASRMSLLPPKFQEKTQPVMSFSGFPYWIQILTCMLHWSLHGVIHFFTSHTTCSRELKTDIRIHTHYEYYNYVRYFCHITSLHGALKDS